MAKGLFLAVLLALAGCAAEPPAPPPPTSVQLTVLASAQLNLTRDGQPAPLRVKLYQLKGSAAFTRADYFALFENASLTLGADLLAEEELLLRPGETLSLQRDMADGTSHLAVLAGFRDLDRAVWRQLTPLQANQVNPLLMTFDARSLVISSSPANP